MNIGERAREEAYIPTVARDIVYGWARGVCGPMAAADQKTKRELEYRIPRLHHPVNSRRFPDIFADLCKITKLYSWRCFRKTVCSRLLP